MRKIVVEAKPGAKENKVQSLNPDHFKVFVTERPEKGKANEALVRILADYFHIPKSKIQILRGETSKKKLIQIDSDSLPLR